MTLENAEAVTTETSSGEPNDASVTTSSEAQTTTTTTSETKSESPKQAWGENWRQELAGEDHAELKRLERLASPKDLWKKTKELEKKFSSGDVQIKLPENASPEEKAEWRKQQGIPDKPEDYKVDLGKYVPTEADLPAFEDFKKYAHDRDMTPSAVNAALGWYAERMNETESLKKEIDESYAQQSDDVLREEWGVDYKANNGVIRNFLSKASPEFNETINSARLEDGTRLSDNPEFKKFLASTALEINPAARILPVNASSDAAQSFIEECEKDMASNIQKWWKDTAKQEKYRIALEAREKMNSRG